MKMYKMMLVQLGVLLLAICTSAQTVAQNSTNTTQVKSSTTNTTMPTGTYSSGNSTNPTGAGVPLHTGTLSVLTPVIMAASLLQLYC